MNFKSKLRVTKPLSTIICLMSIATLSIVFQGCEKEELARNIDMPYLELSSSIDNLGSKDYDVISQAKERLEEYISSDKDKFILKINSGEQVNMSDELFEFFVISISNANDRLKDKNFMIKDDRVIAKVKAEILRLKSGVVEGNDGNNYVLYSGVDYTWYGMRINISHEDITGFQLGSFGLSYILSKCETGIPTIDAWMGAAETISLFSGLLSGYYDNGNGFSIVCPLYVPTYAIGY